ncbi:hypothetical protein BC936DRAFT_145580 [Jimgerdemannia flammicorona]|uniref:Uncharacterized protein n=2 Tax=Jimgerdemannia flammicorona TaxID=994334 RepID=A0A433QXZ8_9FUNG|nr:hypothetical protein BC936DRAFT_145580 [Jimgerdemannia flammicorona]RUS34681.1 hypothetical protein BC938DRAFT_479173 [Jimgerdemannia flammicorona]
MFKTGPNQLMHSNTVLLMYALRRELIPTSMYVQEHEFGWFRSTYQGRDSLYSGSTRLSGRFQSSHNIACEVNNPQKRKSSFARGVPVQGSRKGVCKQRVFLFLEEQLSFDNMAICSTICNVVFSNISNVLKHLSSSKWQKATFLPLPVYVPNNCDRCLDVDDIALPHQFPGAKTRQAIVFGRGFRCKRRDPTPLLFAVPNKKTSNRRGLYKNSPTSNMTCRVVTSFTFIAHPQPHSHPSLTMDIRKSTDSARSAQLQQYATSPPLPIQKSRSISSRHNRPSSISSSVHSNTSSVDQPWPLSGSFDQLNFFTRRSSISSLNKTGSPNTTSPEGIDFQLKEKVRKATADMSTVMKLILNGASLSLYRVTEHIHKKVPVLVDEKKSLAVISAQVDLSNSNVADARRTVDIMSQIQSFNTVWEMLRKSLEIVEAAKKAS